MNALQYNVGLCNAIQYNTNQYKPVHIKMQYDLQTNTMQKQYNTNASYIQNNINAVPLITRQSTQYNTIPTNTLQQNLSNKIQCILILYNTNHINRIKCNGIHCNALQYNTIQQNAILCSAMQ